MEEEKKTHNGEMKFFKRANEIQQDEVTQAFPSGQLEEKRRAGCFCCSLLVLCSKVVNGLSSRCVGNW